MIRSVHSRLSFPLGVGGAAGVTGAVDAYRFGHHADDGEQRGERHRQQDGGNSGVHCGHALSVDWLSPLVQGLCIARAGYTHDPLPDVGKGLQRRLHLYETPPVEPSPLGVSVFLRQGVKASGKVGGRHAVSAEIRVD